MRRESSLKPGNIKVTPEGNVKVLDFGLAKVREAEEPVVNLSNSPTMMSASQPGTILGTVAYMSPEQARGKPVDKRTDIWAFGAVLFEMLTGRQAFSGETVSDTIVAVLSRDVDWNALPPTLPAQIRDLLRRCLQRDPTQRLRDIGDARIELAEALSAGPALPQSSVSKPKRRSVSIALGIPAFLILAGIAFMFGRFSFRSASNDAATGWTGTLLGGPNVAWGPSLQTERRSRFSR